MYPFVYLMTNQSDICTAYRTTHVRGESLLRLRLFGSQMQNLARLFMDYPTHENTKLNVQRIKMISQYGTWTTFHSYLFILLCKRGHQHAVIIKLPSNITN